MFTGVLCQIGLLAGSYGLHSFRIGAAFTAGLGFPAGDIQSIRNWRPAFYKPYVWELASRLSKSSYMSQMLFWVLKLCMLTSALAFVFL